MKNKNYPKIIAAISFLMLMVLGLFSYLNYNRERDFLNEHLLTEGYTLSRILESVVAEGVVTNLGQFQSLIETSFQDKLINQIILVNEKGKIVAHTDAGMIGKMFESFSNYNKKGVKTEIISSGSKNVFQLIKPFFAVNISDSSKSKQNNDTSELLQNNFFTGEAGRLYIIIRFNANEYLNAEKEDLRRAIGTGVLLLLLGFSSLYFVFVINRYHILIDSLHTMKNYITSVVDSMPNGLISLDEQGIIKTINKNATQLLGLNNEEVGGKLLGDLLPNCNVGKTLFHAKYIYNEQINCTLNDGQIIPLSITSSRLTDENNNVLGTVIILRDLRDIKLLEKKVERSERLASLGHMAAGIAHEIRNPLSSIKGFAQYFRNKFEVNSENWKYASVMVKEVDRLNRVIQDLLNFAKPYEPKLNSIEIEKLISHTLRLVESELTEKKIQVVLENTDNIKPVLGDSDLLTQVFLNLFINAIEALDEAGLLKISFSEESEFMIVEVTDNGKGIKPDDLPKIFDPFFTSKQGGTGLGLAIVYRIIENHNGEISVKSELGMGTTFRIKLPKKS
ncbi:MAG: two-component system sensor histidine kinase NtrB [Ignavibacteriaceae bacterium]